MIHYMIGKNKMKCNDFQGAETSLVYGLKILPERIYPYFLLTELYSHPENYNPERLRLAADSVLYKRPKAESTAILEMRTKVNKWFADMKNEQKEVDWPSVFL